jgi:hypothetical protein
MWTAALGLYMHSLLDKADTVSLGISIHALKRISWFEFQRRAGSSGETGSIAGFRPWHNQTGLIGLCEASGE